MPKAEIARRDGIARATVRDWLAYGEADVLSRPMRQRAMPCDGQCQSELDLDEPAYAYLLGQYLGDGCISRVRSSARLRIS